MATKFTVSAKAQVAQASHEREKRQSNVGSAWNEVRIGFIGIMVPTTSDDAASTLESVAYASYIDWFSFGLINNVATIPGQAGTQFVGLSSNTTYAGNTTGVRCKSNASGAATVGEYGVYDYGNFSAIALNGITVVKNNVSGVGSFNFPIYSADGRGALFALKYVVNNPGLSNQTISLSYANPATAVVTAPSTAKATLRSLFTSAAYSSAGTALDWFSGGVALPLPDTWFLRAPFLNNRIRWAVKGGLIIS